MDRKLQKRFTDKFDKSKGCWEWKACRNAYGYGLINVGGVSKLASRVSYQFHKGNVPQKLDVLHHCDNPPCVNPKHLYLGTASENLKDAYARGRRVARKKLSGEQVKWIRTNFDWKRGTIKAFGEKFKVSSSLIAMVVKNRRRFDSSIPILTTDLRRAERL